MEECLLAAPQPPRWGGKMSKQDTLGEGPEGGRVVAPLGGQGLLSRGCLGDRGALQEAAASDVGTPEGSWSSPAPSGEGWGTLTRHTSAASCWAGAGGAWVPEPVGCEDSLEACTAQGLGVSVSDLCWC